MSDSPPARWPVLRAARALSGGGIVAYPTEAVWGLGCDPSSEEALRRLLALKRRPWHKGLILIASEWAQLRPWLAVEDCPEQATRHWPGHVTCLLPAREEVSPLLRGRHTTLAVRITAHPASRALCQAFGGAIVSTSANHHGRPTPTTLLQLRQRFGTSVDYYLNAPLGGATRASRIIDPFSGKRIRS